MSAIDSRTSPERPRAWTLVAAILVATGCGGIPAGSRPPLRDDEYAEARREQDFRNAQEVARGLRAQLAAATAEKEKLAAEVGELQSAVRVERQSADQAAAEKAKLEDRIRAAEIKAEESKRTLERACILLALVATEISSVKSHWREFESRVRESGVRQEDLDVLERNALIGTKIEELHFELIREKNLIAPYLKERRPEPQFVSPRDDEKTRERKMNEGEPGDPLRDTARSPQVAVRPGGEAGATPGRPETEAGVEREESRLERLLRQKWEESSRAGDLGIKIGFAILCGAALVLLLRRSRLRDAPGALRSWFVALAGAMSGLLRRDRAGAEPELVPRRDIEKVLGILEEDREAESPGEAEDAATGRALFEGTPAERARARIAARAAAAASAEAAVLAGDMDGPGADQAAGLEGAATEDPVPSAVPGTEVLGERRAEGEPVSAVEESGTQVLEVERTGTELLERVSAQPEAELTIAMAAPDANSWRRGEDETSVPGEVDPSMPAETQAVDMPAEAVEDSTGTDVIPEAAETWALEPRPRGTGPGAGTQMIGDEAESDFQPTQLLSGEGGLDLSATQPISHYERPAPPTSPPVREHPAGRRQAPPPSKPRKPARKQRGQDEDLLAELEEIMGHKVDEEPA